MHKELLEININSITVKSTLRSELGDLTLLENSIKKLGLLHPPVVDKNNALITGTRRLQACRNIGLSHMTVLKADISIDSMDALDIQSDENFCRLAVSSEDLERHIRTKKDHLPAARPAALAGLWSKMKKLFS